MKKLALAIILCFTALITESYSKDNKEINGKNDKVENTNSKMYFKDKKTNRCYPIIDFSYPLNKNNSNSNISIPCTPEVEKLLVNK